MKPKDWAWMNYGQKVELELRQSKDEGKLVDVPAKLMQDFEAAQGEQKEALAKQILDIAAAAPTMADWPYEEPGSYEEIAQTLGEGFDQVFAVDAGSFAQNMNGAWLGRAVGCLAGIPVEGWSRSQIEGFLKDSGNWPMAGYMRSDVDPALREKYGISDEEKYHSYDRTVVCWGNNVTEFPVDDDMNYVVACLRLLERYGKDFDAGDVAESWLYSIPFMHLCTAERVAAQNLINLVMPPQSAEKYNPYREYIGAQIRTDFYGYIRPGNPAAAAEMAYRDAMVTHTKNGVYGAMYIAALLSMAPVQMPMADKVRAALLQVPPKSRLHEKLAALCSAAAAGQSYSQAMECIYAQYNESDGYDWCHAISNALVVTAILLHFEDDFDGGVARAVEAGFDTDCNGATVGSVLGMALGWQAIGNQWLAGIEPVINTGVCNYTRIPVEQLVQRSLKWVEYPAEKG